MANPARRRLDHVDAMRPVKQAGVITTHSILYFAPAAAAVSSGAVLLLPHVSREGFFFVSACMLTYAYTDLNRAGLRRFYWRRFLSVGVPYLCWTLIYFFFLMPTAHYHSVAAALKALGSMAETGYYQLYFLIVIMQFYVVFPLLLIVLRRTKGHHGLVVAVAVAAQVALAILGHWNLLPSLMQKYEQQDALSYLLYLVGGSVIAFHLEDVDAWVRGHARLIFAAATAAGLAAECVYYLAQYGVTSMLGSGNDAFQPSVIPFNAGAIACGYLAGVALVRPGRSRATKTVVRTGSDDAYGVYLSHMLVITTLLWLGWGKLSSVIPWPLLCLMTVGIIVVCCVPLTALLARTPLAMPLTGRKRVPWHGPDLSAMSWHRHHPSIQIRQDTRPTADQPQLTLCRRPPSARWCQRANLIGAEAPTSQRRGRGRGRGRQPGDHRRRVRPGLTRALHDAAEGVRVGHGRRGRINDRAMRFSRRSSAALAAPEAASIMT